MTLSPLLGLLREDMQAIVSEIQRDKLLAISTHLTPSPGVWTVISTPIVYDLIGDFVRGEVRGDPISHTTVVWTQYRHPEQKQGATDLRGTERCGNCAKGNRSTSDPTSEPD